MAMPNVSQKNNDRRQRGQDGERRARLHLEQHGLRCLDAGWRCRLGELDLVMRDNDALIFVEVRARQTGSLVGAIESVDHRKQQRFVRAARAWLACHPVEAKLPARFDVIAVIDDEIRWLHNAFDVAPH